MTSPNEPGHPGPGDSPNGTGSGDRAVPNAAGRTGPRRGAGPAAAQRGADVRGSRSARRRRRHASRGRRAEPAGAEARVNRFISGTAAPGAAKTPPHEPRPAPRTSESRHDEAYASELPDLSGPIPRGRASQTGRRPQHRTTLDDDRCERKAASRWRARAAGPVRASMQIRRIDPWSTLKVSLVLSVALFFVWMIAVAFLYLVLGGMGVWSKLNSNVGDLLNNTSGSSGELVSSGTIFGGAVLIGLVNIVLLTAMATIGAFIYNLTTDLIGGVEVTLADRD